MEYKSNLEVFILAGGLGTRLKSVIADIPKPMAEINGIPFLHHLVNYLDKFNLNKINFLTGFKSDVIEDYFSREIFHKFTFNFIKENQPLGTGGAVNYGIKELNIQNDFLLLNGDSIFLIDLNDYLDFHFANKSNITLALKQMKNPSRYGTVSLANEKIKEFKEKRDIDEGLINCGVYIFNPSVFRKFESGSRFSLEKDLLEKHLNIEEIYGKTYDSYFIDIGLPESYNEASKKLTYEISKTL